MTTRVRIQQYSQDYDGSVTIDFERNCVWYERIYAERGKPYDIGDAPYMVLKNLRTDRELVFEYNVETEKYEFDLYGGTIAVSGIRVIA